MSVGNGKQVRSNSGAVKSSVTGMHGGTRCEKLRRLTPPALSKILGVGNVFYDRKKKEPPGVRFPPSTGAERSRGEQSEQRPSIVCDLLSWMAGQAEAKQRLCHRQRALTPEHFLTTNPKTKTTYTSVCPTMCGELFSLSPRTVTTANGSDVPMKPFRFLRFLALKCNCNRVVMVRVQQMAERRCS